MYNKDEERELPMKKIKNILLLLTIVIAIPATIYAKSYTALNLEETFAREKIEHDLEEYKETSDQITIYMFRGDRCGYCQNFLKFLQENVKEYGKYFKLRSYEIWHNENNASLMGEVAEHFNKKTSAVPLIVIGEKVFQGYNTSYDKEILEAITNYYNNKESYKDVVSTFLVEKEESTTGAAVTILVLVSIIAGIGFLMYMAKNETPILEETKEEKTISTIREETKTEKKENTNAKEKRIVKSPTLPILKETKTNKKEQGKETITPKKKAPANALPKKKEATAKTTTTKKVTTTPKTKTSVKKNTRTTKTNESKSTSSKTTKKTTTNQTNKKKARTN